MRLGEILSLQWRKVEIFNFFIFNELRVREMRREKDSGSVGRRFDSCQACQLLRFNLY